ncbi:MAG: hypothetical protein ACI9XJ_002625, partial [Marivirga sp.]
VFSRQLYEKISKSPSTSLLESVQRIMKQVITHKYSLL